MLTTEKSITGAGLLARERACLKSDFRTRFEATVRCCFPQCSAASREAARALAGARATSGHPGEKNAPVTTV